MTNHILVVDDDERLRKLLKKYLVGEGFCVSTAENAAKAREFLEKETPDLIVLDVMMPGETGIELTASLRENISTPILLLTAMGEVENRIAGLESGANDYLAKPFEPRELLLRIKNILKTTTNKTVEFGNYTFNIEAGDLRKNGEIMNLSSTELTMLTIFANSINKPVTREYLSKKLNNISERSVDVQITRLRKRIEDDPSEPIYLQTARGKGYILRSRS